ncbi:hypothetical protein AnigIFM56816_006162 [Aspergillus niger]|nr:hypothetical protein AnigIFM50267_007264 [Aspergillus niger]GKZ81641.1 hypothetical protein AnigIFM56816_006162 [Aspergillus niger]
MGKWAATVMGLFWALFSCHALAFPFEPFPSEADVFSPANGSDLAPRHLFKRAPRYPRVKYGSTCSAAQQEYIDTELDEVQTMLSRSLQQLQTLRSVIRERQEPATWGIREAEYTRLFNAWVSMMGTIQFNPTTERPPGANDQPLSWRTTDRNIGSLMSIYRRIRRTLQDRTLAITIHCNDEFWKWDKDLSTNEKRIYRDTRPVGEAAQPFMKLDEPGRLCHEGKGGNGWRMLNEVTQEDEICICPVVFERTATSNTLSSLPNTKESLKGRHIDDIKRYYAAGTLLHEISHCSTILGADRTRRPFLTIAFESLAE